VNSIKRIKGPLYIQGEKEKIVERERRKTEGKEKRIEGS